MKHWLTYSFCLITCVINAQVIKFQSVGGAGTVPSQATNGTMRHSMALGTTVSQGSNQSNQTGFFFGNIDYRPAQQASAILFSNLDPLQLTLTWSNGNGVRRVVVAHSSSAVNAILPGGTFYGDAGANASFGTGTEIGASSGNFVVYDGTGSIVTVTNLSPSTEYNFKVFEYNGKYDNNYVNIEYQTGDGLTNNPSKRTTLALKPLNSASGLGFTNVTKNQTTLSWINGDGNKRLVLMKEGNQVNDLPQNGSFYTANTLFSAAPELSSGSGNYIVFDGATSQVTVTGLLPNTVYHYKVIEYKGSGLDNNYLTTTTSVASQLTLTLEPVAVDESVITQTSFSANWQQVSGATDYYIDVSDNTNFTSFVTNFQNKKISGGSLTASVTVLIPGTTYYYRVRAENAAGQSANSNTIEVLTVPASPTVLASSNVATTSFTTNWSASASATEYFLDVATDEGFTQFVGGFSNKSVSTNSSDVTGLAAGTNYFVRVRAKNLSGVSPNPTSGYKQITLTDAPIALDASNEQKSSFKAKWTTVKGAAEYEVNVLNDVTGSAVNGYPKLVAHPQSEEIVAGLSPATKYKYFVRGKNDGGYSANSNIKIVITLDDGGQVFNKPAITVNTAQSSITNVSAQVSNGEPPLIVTFKHRTITGEKYTTETPANLPATNVSRSQALEAAWSDELGIEYYFVVSDNAGRKDSTKSFYAYKSFAAQNIPGFIGFDGTDEGYKMFSIPADLKDNDIKALFQPVQTQFGGYDKEKWRLFHYPGGVDQQYLENETDLFKIEQGWGYWFNARENPSALSITASVLQKNQSESFKMTLKAGWNQIGNPYPFNILWSTVQAANSGAELKKLWLFNRKYEPKEVLPAWQGAFVFSAKGGEIQFPVSAKTSRSVRTASPDFPNKPDDGIWFLPIAMTFHELHHVGAIGMHPDASDDMDKFDEPTLPRFVSFLEMKTRHENSLARNFSEDVVKSSHHYTWSFTVSSNLTDGEGELNWENLTMNWQNVSSSLMLLDVSQQVLLDMRTAQRYRFPFENGKQFKIIFSKEGIYKAGTTRLGEAYPNPFANHISVPVLAEEENEIIRLEFFDLLGRRLISLQQQFPVPGQYVFEWDGRTSLGEPVPEGLILYHTRKEDGSKTGVKRLVKIN